jgi:hypothetical protein
MRTFSRLDRTFHSGMGTFCGGKVLLWMCCVCLTVSRHLNSVECEICPASAHAKCASFKTFKEARESNRPFFCPRCSPSSNPSPSIASPITQCALPNTSSPSPPNVRGERVISKSRMEHCFTDFLRLKAPKWTEERYC